MTKFIKYNLIFFFLFCSATDSFACSCPQNEEQLILDYLDTDIIFEGKVSKIKPTKLYQEVILKVQKVEKGKFTKNRIKIYIDNECSFQIKKGEIWLIGADIRNKKYYTDICYTNYNIASTSYLNFRYLLLSYFSRIFLLF